MKSSKAAAGGIAVGAILIVKLVAKTAFIGAIFGGAFGGASYAKTAYETSIDHMKTEAAYYSQKHGGEMLNAYVRMDSMIVDEDRKRLIVNTTAPDVTKESLGKLKVSELADAEKDDKDHMIFEYKSDKDVKVLFKHDWEVEFKLKTSDGELFEDIFINSSDIL